ncbi:adenylate/guanylate cyclase domain-containing protein [Amycolatopsis sp.]|uniref:adenylate/guanylate cyclase domain-containing protein n=1 Tax=Amycolatopsis sp. TaxID=37632 RepID=UPI002BD45008|nr:adenylate/guanylate cyclase domain-containing protein [Amycolatopsis sp.]HVV14695.1 adenylate/guanylate cyclase domain-containing protein [Amycolatopsis sp.]
MNEERPRLRRFLRDADRNGAMVRTARTVRRLAPGSEQLMGGARASDRVARLIAEAGTDQPSATRELGLAAVQVWQSLSRSRAVAANGAEVTILFTDLVGFSSWALHAGDDHVLRLLREVGDVSRAAVQRHGGTVVKFLGDGMMAVFADTPEAISAAYEACTAVSAITLDGYRPQLRTGMHAGRPKRVGRDYLGVDVNVAARVADAASGGEILVSGPALSTVDSDRYVVRRRRFRAKGAPRDLEVYSVVPRGHSS